MVRQINANIDTARETKAFEQWNRNWVTFVERNIGAWMHVEHGLGLYLFANANRRAPTNMHNNAISVNSMHRIRSAQDLALYNLTLSEEIEGFDGAAHIETWNSDPAWQGVREPPSSSPPSTTGARRSSPPTSSSSRSSASCSAASSCSRRHRATATSSRPTVVGAGEYDYAERDLRYTKAMFELLTNDKEFADHNKAPAWSVALDVGAAVHRRSPRRCSRCGRSPTPSRLRFEDGLDRAKSRFSGILSELSLTDTEGADPVTTSQDRRPRARSSPTTPPRTCAASR